MLFAYMAYQLLIYFSTLIISDTFIFAKLSKIMSYRVTQMGRK